MAIYECGGTGEVTGEALRLQSIIKLEEKADSSEYLPVHKSIKEGWKFPTLTVVLWKSRKNEVVDCLMKPLLQNWSFEV